MTASILISLVFAKFVPKTAAFGVVWTGVLEAIIISDTKKAIDEWWLTHSRNHCTTLRLTFGMNIHWVLLLVYRACTLHGNGPQNNHQQAQMKHCFS